MLRSFIHARRVFIGFHFVLESNGGSDSHGNILRRDNMYFLFAQFGCLIRSKNNVPVIRQDKNAFGGHLIHSIQQIIHGGIHGLSAFHNFVHIQILEKLGKTGSQGHSNKPVAFFGFGRLIRFYFVLGSFRLRIVFRLPLAFHFKQIVNPYF